MKYIDAEKLKAEIDKLHDAPVPKHDQQCDFSDGYSWGLSDIENLIDSLQQEQPDCHTVEDWIQHIKNADQLTKDIFSKGPYDVLYDALNHPYQHCYDAIKEFGELCFQTGVNSVKQKQQEVDLEKAARYVYESWMGGTMDEVRRDMVELGKVLNARKED